MICNAISGFATDHSQRNKSREPRANIPLICISYYYLIPYSLNTSNGEDTISACTFWSGWAIAIRDRRRVHIVCIVDLEDSHFFNEIAVLNPGREEEDSVSKESLAVPADNFGLEKLLLPLGPAFDVVECFDNEVQRESAVEHADGFYGEEVVEHVIALRVTKTYSFLPDLELGSVLEAGEVLGVLEKVVREEFHFFLGLPLLKKLTSLTPFSCSMHRFSGTTKSSGRSY